MLKGYRMLTGKIMHMKSVRLCLNLNTVVNYQFSRHTKSILDNAQQPQLRSNQKRRNTKSQFDKYNSIQIQSTKYNKSQKIKFTKPQQINSRKLQSIEFNKTEQIKYNKPQQIKFDNFQKRKLYKRQQRKLNKFKLEEINIEPKQKQIKQKKQINQIKQSSFLRNNRVKDQIKQSSFLRNNRVKDMDNSQQAKQFRRLNKLLNKKDELGQIKQQIINIQGQFLRQNKRINTTRVRNKLKNSEQFIIDSNYHKNYVNIKELISEINRIIDNKNENNLISKQIKDELITIIQQLQRQRMRIKNKEQLQILLSSKQQVLKQLQLIKENRYSQISQYLQKYNKLSNLIQNILIVIQYHNSKQLLINELMLRIIRQYNLLQYYIYYMYKLLIISDKQKIKQMDKQQILYNKLIINNISQMPYQYVNRVMPFYLQRYSGQFFEFKLTQIINKLSSTIISSQSNTTDFFFPQVLTQQQNIKNKKQNYKQSKKQIKSPIINKQNKSSIIHKQNKSNIITQIDYRINILNKIQKIFKYTHATYGKRIFYIQFIKYSIKYINQLSLPSIIDLFDLCIKNLYLDKQIISKFQQRIISSTHSPNFNLSQISHQQIMKFIHIYQTIGQVPQIIYHKYISQILYNSDNQEYKIAQNIQSYVRIGYQDLSGLKQLLNKLNKIIAYKSGIISKTNKRSLHFSIHYLCILYPYISQYQSIKQALGYCKSYTDKDYLVLNHIMKKIYLQSKIFNKYSNRQSKRSQNKQFYSPCIQKKTYKIDDNYKSGLSSLQQQIFKQQLTQVLTKLNSSVNNNTGIKSNNGQYNGYYYEMRQNFSFCSFELDVVILKWDSMDRKRLIGYLDIQCVGLQYSYDGSQKFEQSQIKKRLKQSSLIESEQSLILIRKKKVRQMVLRHYGFEILYILNQYLQSKFIDKQLLKQKLLTAIVQKLSTKK